MPIPKYFFKEGVKKSFQELLHPNVQTVSTLEFEPTSVFIEVGQGTNSALFEINQETGLVQVKLMDPSTNDNEWGGEFSKSAIEILQEHVISPKKGGKRKSRKRRTMRKRSLRKRSLRKRSLRKRLSKK